ncbi:hypothetical protein [Prosthecobacter fluviatilis]|uniref:Uncharacterized protein n=1 Tax=Prosthecobacter fluviatilis TaxID=445931 RepID=A0ABW0KUM9_9BACT
MEWQTATCTQRPVSINRERACPHEQPTSRKTILMGGDVAVSI